MPQPQEAHKAKKRKHAASAAAAVGAAAVAGEPSAKRIKKEKDAKRAAVAVVKDENKPAAAQKKAKAEKRTGARQDKGKGRATDDAFRVVRASLTVSVPPVFASDLRGGVEELLDSMLMRYIPALQGVVLAHDRLEFLDQAATIKADCPFANCRIAFDATVWSPQVGMKLAGKINLCSPDHISLLVHRTFNVSIPRHHIPTESYEFEYGPAENDPEYGAVHQKEASGEGADVEVVQEEQVESGGRWVHALTGTRLGEADGHLEFTVVGMTIANQMLSLVGSIQPDPFSPDHVPQATTTTAPAATQRKVVPQSHSVSEREVDAMIEDDEDDSDEDAFQALSKKADEEERRAREALEEEARKESKRKRKEKKGDGATTAGEKSKKRKS